MWYRRMQRLAQWHQTKLGYAVFALAELGAAYAFASMAIDQGNLLYYLLALVLALGVLQNVVKLIWKLGHDQAASAG